MQNWLESSELQELILIETETIINAELEKFEGLIKIEM